MSDQLASDEHEHETKEGGFVSHLIELRSRLLKMILAVLIVFMCLFPFANELYALLAEPLIANLPQGSSMIAIDVAAPFLIPFKFVMLLSIIISVPYLLYNVWGFIAPGLYKHEQKLVFPLLFSSTLLFYMGTLFAYFVVFPLVFNFFISIAPEGISVMTDIGRYLDFVITLFLAFGLAFEVPIATILLVIIGVTTPEKLAEKRSYVIVGVFIIGMLLTPPDIISQVLLALPMWVLFELGIIFSKIAVNKKVISKETE